MSHKIYVISDLHLSHKGMAELRGFSSIEEHDNHIIESWNSVVNKKDTVYVLGDITMEKVAPYHLLDNLKGIKKVVGGNHDKPQHTKEMLKYVDGYCGMLQYKGIVFTHCPIHPSELHDRYSVNVHGHVHSKTLDDPRYINVCAEVLNYVPVLVSGIREYDHFRRVDREIIENLFVGGLPEDEY